MKLRKLFLFLTAILTLGIFITGCKKQEVEMPKNELNNTVTSKITVINGMLSFSNIESFQNTLTELEDNNNLFNNKFSEDIDRMNFVEIEKYIEVSKWNENEIFETFEDKYNYISLRSIIAKEIIEFNKIYDQSKVINPDNHFVSNQYLRTLLNEDCQVLIGTTIYRFLEQGILVKVLDKNFDLANKINITNYNDFLKNERIVFEGLEECKGSNCNSYGRFVWYSFSNRLSENNKEIKISVRCDVDNNTIARNIRGVAKAEYWSGSRWRYYRVKYMQINPGGDVHSLYCNGSIYRQGKVKEGNNVYKLSETAPVRINGDKRKFVFESGKVGVLVEVRLNNGQSLWQIKYITF